VKKYLTLFGLSWQRQLETRSDFFFERARSICILISLYFLWSSLLSAKVYILGYSREHMLTYVLAMTLLRAWVLGCVTDRIPMEIAKGKLSDVILKPLSHLGYWISQDAASKSLNLFFALMEVSIFMVLCRATFFVQTDPLLLLSFVAATLAAMVLYFQMSYLLGVMGFWTAQSWGPRFCFEITLEFCAGAYFPIDILPLAFQKVLGFLPFPYLVYAPLSIYLGRLNSREILSCFLHQGLWIAAFSIVVHYSWKAGLKKYAAEGR
jgi:ABC-2 type transport system permease protein